MCVCTLKHIINADNGEVQKNSDAENKLLKEHAIIAKHNSRNLGEKNA